MQIDFDKLKQLVDFAIEQGNYLPALRLALDWAEQANKYAMLSLKGYRITKDGNQWCAVNDSFINLQESIAGFGDNPIMALSMLIGQENKKD